MNAPAGRLQPWRLARATPATVWLLCGLQLLLAVWYAFAVPLLHAPDEHSHVDRVLSPGEPADLDPLEDDELSERTVAILPRVQLAAIDWRVAPYQPWQGLAEDDALPRDARPSYAGLGPDEDSGIPNQVASHPPLYYLYEAAGLRAVRTLDGLIGGDDPASWDRTLVVLRLLSALLVLPLPWLTYWTAVRLSGRAGVGLVAAMVPVAVPQVSHIAGSVNNDVMLLSTSAVAMMGAVWIATGDRSLRTAGLTGAAAGLALLTKIFALAAPLWIVAAYGVGWARSRASDGELRPFSTGQVARGLGVAAVATVAFGGWFVVRAVMLYGTPAPRGSGYPGSTVGPDLGFWLGELVSRSTRSFWGFFGVEQFAIPGWVVAALTSAALTAVGLALLRGRWERRAGWRAADLAVLLLPGLTALAMMLFAAWNGYLASGLPVGIHGRYLFTGLLGLSVAVGLGVDAVARSRSTPAIVAVIAVVVQAVGAWTVVRSFWAGPDVLAEVRAMLAWSPFRARYVVVLWGLLSLTAVAALWRLVTDPLRWSPVAVGDGPPAPDRGRSARRQPPPA